MKNIVSISLLTAFAVAFNTGCSGPSLPEINKEATERQVNASASLVDFMNKNPDIAKTSLKDLRSAAGGSSFVVDTAVPAHMLAYSTTPLKTDKASEAVGLVDDVLSLKLVETFVSAFIKVGAVALNFQDEMHNGEFEDKGRPAGARGEKPKEGAAGFFADVLEKKGESAPKGSGAPVKGEGSKNAGFKKINMKCEDAMDKPGKFMEEVTEGKITEKRLDDLITEGEKEFKNLVGTCSKISAGAFAKCMKNLSSAAKGIHDNAKCTMDKSEFKKMIDSAQGSLESAMQSCMNAFKKCGFKLEEEGSEEMAGAEMEMGEQDGKPKQEGKAGVGSEKR